MFIHIGNIGRKLLILSFAGTLLPLLIMGGISVFYTARTIRNQTLRELEIVAESTKGEIQDFFKYHKARIQDFSSDGFIKNSLENIYLDKPDKDETINKLSRHLLINKLPILKDILEIFIVNRDGTIIASTNSSQIGKNCRNEKYFQKGSDKIYISDNMCFNEQKQASWIVSAPITGSNSNQFLGVISNRIHPKTLSDITTGRATELSHPETRFKRIGATGETFLVNKDRKMLTESRFIKDAELRQTVDTVPVKEAFDLNKEMLGSYIDYRGVSIIGASKIIEETGWLILSEIDKNEAFYPIHKFIIIAIIMTIVFVPIFFLITLIIVKNLTKPIMDVVGASQRITNGNLNERVIINKGSGEIVMLAKAFNTMVESLLESRDKLELRVKERTSELNSANEEIKRFVYIVSHDLRAPLVNIKGFSDELQLSIKVIDSIYKSILQHLTNEQQNELSAVLNEDIPESLGFIRTSTTRMDNLITAVLKLSRIGKGSIAFEEIDMNELVNNITKTLAHQISKGRVEIECSHLPRIVAARTSMEQIMSNLLDNAVKYIESGHKGVIKITCEQNKNETVFHIRDNGRGISINETVNIFDIFHRSGKQDTPGEGMGLSYVKTLVQYHDGKIWCESDIGKGSTFSFTISNHFQTGDKDER